MEYTRDFSRISRADLPLVGGKGANLGEMQRSGQPVPPGFCITVAGFNRFMRAAVNVDEYLHQLSDLDPNDVASVREIGGALRAYLLSQPVPDDVGTAVLAAWAAHGRAHFYAVRSSATAEDLPTASFAGQQDTYLNISGEAPLLDSVHRCWVSLFTDRAILYRAQNGFDHERVRLSVIVQRMVRPQVSGTLFTADPISGNRQMMAIDASFGLGEALVAGLVTPDSYMVDKMRGELVQCVVADKKIAVQPLPNGGTEQVMLPIKQRRARALLDSQIFRLAKIACQIEDHYHAPQDIEWAIENGEIFILQSRPITSLFPIPAPRARHGLRVYVSASHAQVMTAPISPAGISVWRVLLPFGREDRFRGNNPYVISAAGRFYLDISPMLYTRLGRKALPRFLTVADELMGLALRELVARPDFATHMAGIPDRTQLSNTLRWLLPAVRRALINLWFRAPAQAAPGLNAHIHRAVQRMEVLQVEKDLLERLKASYTFIQGAFAREAMLIVPYIMTAMMAKVFLEKLMNQEATAADLAAVQAGLAGNVTTEMDLLLGDLSDLARESSVVAATIVAGPPETIQSRLQATAGSGRFLDGLTAFLQNYGMRGPGEIDIGRPRWKDDPTPLLMMVRGNLAGQQSRIHRLHFAGKRAAAEEAAKRLESLARQHNWLKGRLVRRLITVFRAYMPLREHPKFMLVHMFQMLREQIQAVGRQWATDGRLLAAEDVWLLYISEIIHALEDTAVDLHPLVAERRTAYEHFERLVPPRVMTSTGEQIVGRYSTEGLPPGSIPGSPVSGGVVEGIARVVLNPAEEVLEPGEILIAPFTDPAWTPLFINAAGLVLEVGGLMTHGSVVAREYGIPAVVGVTFATQLIHTGQRIRVNGDRGFVEILDEAGVAIANKNSQEDSPLAPE